jgi:large subunit ribosomal protein L35
LTAAGAAGCVRRLSFANGSAITRPSRRPADRAAVAAAVSGRDCSGTRPLIHEQSSADPASRPRSIAPEQESQMPKIKTKSGAKKRFKVTAGGKVLYQQSRKRHGMIKRTKKQIRQLRGTNVLFKTDGDRIKKYFLPNG